MIKLRGEGTSEPISEINKMPNKNLEKRTEDDSFYDFVDGVRIAGYALLGLMTIYLTSKAIQYTTLPSEQKAEVRKTFFGNCPKVDMPKEYHNASVYSNGRF